MCLFNKPPFLLSLGDYDGRSLPYLPVDISQPPPGYTLPPPGPFMGMPPPMGVPPPSIEGSYQGPPPPQQQPQPQEVVVVEGSPREEGEHSGDDSGEEGKERSVMDLLISWNGSHMKVNRCIEPPQQLIYVWLRLQKFNLVATSFMICLS